MPFFAVTLGHLAEVLGSLAAAAAVSVQACSKADAICKTDKCQSFSGVSLQALCISQIRWRQACISQTATQLRLSLGRQVRLIVHTSAAMNKYSNTNGKVEITAQFRLSECRRLYSALLLGIKPNLPNPPFGSSLPRIPLFSSFWTDNTFFSHPHCPPCALAKCCYGNQLFSQQDDLFLQDRRWEGREVETD